MNPTEPPPPSSRPSSLRLASRPSSLRLALWLTWRDFLHEWRVSTCQILALAAVLTPLLVLFGLKSGIVAALQQRLLADPINLEVVLVGNARFERAWFEQMAKRPDVGFIVGRTRSLAATVDLQGAEGRALSGLEMVPTAPNDPLTKEAKATPLGAGEVLLSHSAARQLQVEVGGTVRSIVARVVEGERQVARWNGVVAGILPEARFGRDAVFVPLSLLVAVEDFRDGYAVPALGISQGSPVPTTERAFASARLFARGLDDVEGVADHLRGLGLEVRTRSAEIATVKALDRVLSFLFQVIAGIAIIGFLLSLAVSLWADVERKNRDLALMRLLGFPGLAVALFPAGRAVLVAVAGALISLATYAVVAVVFNAALASNLAQEEFVCRLLPRDAGLGVLFTVLLALLASGGGGYRASRIDPAQSLRDL